MKNALGTFILFLTLLPAEIVIFVYWLHMDQSRYEWAIQGPYPFSHIGGGPFILFLTIGSIVLGILGITTWLMLNRR